MPATITFSSVSPIPAFAPQKLGISATYAVRPYDVTFNSKTIRRFLDIYGNSRLPITGICESFFSNVEFGDIPSNSGGIGNAVSKLMAVNKPILITGYPPAGGSETLYNANWDILFATAHPTLREQSTETIYQYQSMPLTVTHNKTGTSKVYWGTSSNATYSSYSKEIWLSAISQAVTKVEFINSSSQIVKTYTVKQCAKTLNSDRVYVRWIDIFGTYKYYMFDVSTVSEDADTNGIFRKDVTYFNANDAALGIIPSRIQVKNRAVTKKIVAGVSAIDDELFPHMLSLSRALKVWIFDGVNWIEVTMSASQVQRTVLNGLPSVEFEFIYPEYYTQTI